MVRKCLGFIVVIGVVLASVTSVGAAGATQHYTIANSGSTDSGTCGTDWAADSFDRDYTISAGQVVEKFKNGTFTTFAAPSPGACETATPTGHIVTPGITGKFEGDEIILVTGGTYNPNASCTPATCNGTAGVIATYFGAGATTAVNTFEFHYSAGKYGEWKNASADRGGNHGDIFTS
jgi:hypothetical protein